MTQCHYLHVPAEPSQEADTKQKTQKRRKKKTTQKKDEGKEEKEKEEQFVGWLLNVPATC